jgi:hypothetical protein
MRLRNAGAKVFTPRLASLFVKCARQAEPEPLGLVGSVTAEAAGRIYPSAFAGGVALTRKRTTYFVHLIDPWQLSFRISTRGPNHGPMDGGWPLESVCSDFGPAGDLQQLWVDRRTLNGMQGARPSNVVRSMAATYFAILQTKLGARVELWPEHLRREWIYAALWAYGGAKRANVVVPGSSLLDSDRHSETVELEQMLSNAQLNGISEREYQFLYHVVDRVLGGSRRLDARATPQRIAVDGQLLKQGTADLDRGDVALSGTSVLWRKLTDRARRKNSNSVAHRNAINALHAFARECFGRVYARLFTLIVASLYEPKASRSVVDPSLSTVTAGNRRFYSLHMLLHGELRVEDALGRIEPMAGLPLSLHPATSLLLATKTGRRIVGELVREPHERMRREAFASALKYALFRYAAASPLGASASRAHDAMRSAA